MLKQTILSQQQNKQHDNKHQNQNKGKSSLIVDADLEAALLSLDQSQLTQKLMTEFRDSGPAQTAANLLVSRKASLPLQNPNQTQEVLAAGVPPNADRKSHLESLIHQLIVRKEITQSPNIH